MTKPTTECALSEDSDQTGLLVLSRGGSIILPVTWVAGREQITGTDQIDLRKAVKLF